MYLTIMFLFQASYVSYGRDWPTFSESVQPVHISSTRNINDCALNNKFNIIAGNKNNFIRNYYYNNRFYTFFSMNKLAN